MAHKLAFLTIGATAEFPALVEAAVTPQFLKALEEQEYTELLVQYGQDGKPLFEKCQKLATQSGTSVKVSGFGIDKTQLVDAEAADFHACARLCCKLLALLEQRFAILTVLH